MGDQALHMVVGNQIDFSTHRRILLFIQQLKKQPISGVTEWVPTYHAITLFYRPEVITYHQLYSKVIRRWDDSTQQPTPITTRLVEIPVCYGEPWGLDLDYVAHFNNLNPKEVIAIHTQPTYHVYMIGFTPGFPYLGGMSKRIATPRKKNPRKQVFNGAVGIADRQTGIYSLPSPGGWNLIGRTPIQLFNPKRSPASWLQMGDQIRFYSIDIKEFEEIQVAWKNRSYQCKISKVIIDGNSSY